MNSYRVIHSDNSKIGDSAMAVMYYFDDYSPDFRSKSLFDYIADKKKNIELSELSILFEQLEQLGITFKDNPKSMTGRASICEQLSISYDIDTASYSLLLKNLIAIKEHIGTILTQYPALEKINSYRDKYSSLINYRPSKDQPFSKIQAQYLSEKQLRIL